VADEPVRKVSEPKSPWVPIGLVVLGVLLLLAVCLGAVGLAVRQLVLFGKEVAQKVDQSVAQAAQGLEAVGVVVTFKDHLVNGRTEIAYGLTSEGFQRRMTLEQFKALVAQHPELSVPGVGITVEEQTETSATYRVMQGQANGRQTECKVRLVKEKGTWKIEEIVFP
jgi:hypothetical protein